MALIAKPIAFFSEFEEHSGILKRKFEHMGGGSFSSPDSIGLEGSLKRKRRNVRTFHNYWYVMYIVVEKFVTGIIFILHHNQKYCHILCSSPFNFEIFFFFNA